MVSGRYRSGDIAFSWTHVMPLTEGGISSNTGGAAQQRCLPGEGSAAADPGEARHPQEVRREGTSRCIGYVILLRDPGAGRRAIAARGFIAYA